MGIIIKSQREIASIKEAGQNYNINSGDISRCCQGKHSYCGKLKTGEKLVWRYL